MSSHKLCQYIIKKYIQTNINWPREIKIAQKLIKQYKGDKFWNNLNSAKLNSLAWFLTEDGIKFINLELKKQNLKETDRISYSIKDKKVGEDKNTCQKPKTLLQFIRSWEENLKKKQ
jgi:hypothetical protein